jgi:hypothetical protein
VIEISLFDKKAVSAAEKNYAKRKLEDRDRRGFAMIAQFLCQYVKVSEPAMSEMIAKVGPAWEIDSKKLVQEKGPEAKPLAMEDLFSRVAREVKVLLAKPADAGTIDSGFKEAFAAWKKREGF